MAFQILINILTAVMWMFLQNSFTPSSFVFGYIIGLFILFILRRFLVFDFYFRRFWALIKLIFIFIIELTKANIDMVNVVLRPKMNHKPGIIACRTELESQVEITLLAALISLTPGTISMEFSEDDRTIYIHSIDASDQDEMMEEIHSTFERAIMEVTK